MRNVFEDREMDEAERVQELEFVLSPTVLIGIVLGLFILFGVCFGLGFSFGHHSSTEIPAAALPHAANTETAIAATSRPKPSAAPPAETAASPDATADAPAGSTDPGADSVATNSVGQPGNPPSASQLAGSPAGSQWTVKPALPAQSAQTQTPSPSGPGSPVAPALAVPANAIMVQIAAVSHAEDAEVLVNALRRRGYAVTVRRDPADALLHVQVGPFASRNDANNMRLKLLNDGYNAIVEP
jgi:DedD protein